MRKEGQEFGKKISLAQPLGDRKRGKSRLFWRDEVDEDARMFEIRNWWIMTRDCDVWKGFPRFRDEL